MTEPTVHNIIYNTEQRWLDKLATFVDNHFQQIFLPSHDHRHHLRTWKIAKDIIINISELNSCINEEFIEALLFATMFHDTGMTVSHNVDHGIHSKVIFEKFLEKESYKPPLYKNICEAIENHDKKGQDIYELITFDKAPDLLTMTSISDDMDALGLIGVYRYTEIYLHRAIPLHRLGMQVLENVTTRYNKLNKAMTLFPTITKDTRQSYQEIISFFDQYNQQLLIETNPEKVYSGHIGIVNYIKQFSVRGKYLPTEYLAALEPFTRSKFIDDFFLRLQNEFTATD